MGNLSRPKRQAKGKSALDKPFKILIFFVLAATLIPVAITLMVAVDTSSWDSSWVTIWNLLPLFAILVTLAVVAGWVAYKRGMFGFAPLWLVPDFNGFFVGHMSEIALVAGVAVIAIAYIRRMRRLARSDAASA